MLDTLSAAEAGGAQAGPPPAGVVSDALCALDILAGLTLDPAVASITALTAGGQQQQHHHQQRVLTGAVVAADGARLRRSGGGTGSSSELGARERSHLLVLYAPLARCIECSDARVRGALRRVMLLAGQELGLVAASPAPPAPLERATSSEPPELQPPQPQSLV